MNMFDCLAKLSAHRDALKDAFQVVFWMVASVGGLVTAWKAVVELRRANVERTESRAERALEHRWRQAEAGKQLIDELLKNQKAAEALRVLDIDGHVISVLGREHGIQTDHDQLHEALRTTNMILTDEELIIRETFDELLGALDRMEHYIRIGLTLSEDVMPPFDYYARKAAEVKDVVEGYAKFFEFHRALSFLSRFPQYQSASKVPTKDTRDGA